MDIRVVALASCLAIVCACGGDSTADGKEKEPDPNPVAEQGDGATKPSARVDAGKPATRDAAIAAAPDAATQAPSANGTGPGDWSTGDYPPDIHAQQYLEIPDLPGSKGKVRTYKVHVPTGYDPSRPAPVVFCFHGLSLDAVRFCVDATGLPAKSDAEGFVLVMPNGVDNSWDAGSCCSNNGLDEPEFIRAVFQQVSEHLNIDLGRVYATGLSNGGYLSYRVGCELSDLFVAVAPSAGAVGIPEITDGTGAASVFTSDFTKCAPEQHVSVLDIHGTADALVAYSLQKPSLDLMAKSNGCDLTTLPATVPTSGGDTSCVTYTGCPTGIEVTGCTVQDGGHCWFGDPSGSCGTNDTGGVLRAIVGTDSKYLVNTDAVWAFFSRLSR